MQGTRVQSLVRELRFPHATEQLSPRATTTEPAHLNERARVPQTTEPTHSGAHAPQLERENPHATTREKPVRHNEDLAHQRSRIPQLRSNAAKKTKGPSALLQSILPTSSQEITEIFKTISFKEW